MSEEDIKQIQGLIKWLKWFLGIGSSLLVIGFVQLVLMWSDVQYLKENKVDHNITNDLGWELNINSSGTNKLYLDHYGVKLFSTTRGQQINNIPE